MSGTNREISLKLHSAFCGPIAASGCASAGDRMGVIAGTLAASTRADFVSKGRVTI